MSILEHTELPKCSLGREDGKQQKEPCGHHVRIQGRQSEVRARSSPGVQRVLDALLI